MNTGRHAIAKHAIDQQEHRHSNHHRTLPPPLAPHAEFTTNLTQLLLSKGLPPNQEHVGVWPWPARTVDDFVVAAGRVPHLDADFELWNAHK